MAIATITIVARSSQTRKCHFKREIGPWSHSPEPACVGLCQARQCIPHLQVGESVVQQHEVAGLVDVVRIGRES